MKRKYYLFDILAPYVVEAAGITTAISGFSEEEPNVSGIIAGMFLYLSGRLYGDVVKMVERSQQHKSRAEGELSDKVNGGN